MPRTSEAPGLKWRANRDGSQAAYWRARADLIKAGYLPKTVRLHYMPGDPALIARCQALQAEMLQWATERKTYIDMAVEFGREARDYKPVIQGVRLFRPNLRRA